MKKPRFGASGQSQDTAVKCVNPRHGAKGQAKGNGSYQKQPRFGAIGQPKATSETAGPRGSFNSRRA